MSPKVKFLICSVASCFLPAYCLADGVDLVRYFTRVGRHESVFVIAALVIALMAINYLLNLIFIGLPAMYVGKVPSRTVLRDMILVTLLGQVADRVGALCAGLLAGPVTAWLGRSGEGAWVLPLITLNFVCSGIAIGAISYAFCRFRWRIRGTRSFAVVMSAAVFTNPGYLMVLGGMM